MHDHFMKHYGCYLKEHYSDLDNMSCSDLKEAKEIAKTMKEIFEADKEYNIVKAMEEAEDQSSVKMNWDEFLIRFKNMYNSASADEKMVMKSEITKLIM